MGKFTNFDFKSLVFGAAIAAGFVILGSMYNEFLYAFASIGFLYVGYNAPNIKTSALLGAFASTGMLVAVIGAWAKRSRVKAKEEYEKKQKIGKNKKKKQKAEEPQKENKGLLGKITKKE